ncbi:MAG: class I SAM-dependent methyltransferase [Nitrospinaceae bacterium]
MTRPEIHIPEDSLFLTTDTRRTRWAVPYNFECLNARIDTLLARHRDAISGKTVLDIGSHIGTFSYAANQLGAKKVQGVDVEEKMVHRCRELFDRHRIPESACRFEVADIFTFLENGPENRFDTILCFGALYYTREPYRLLELMNRAARETVLLDTFTAGYAAVQGKDAAGIYPHITEETLDLPLMLVSLTQPGKKDYRLPHSFPFRGKTLSLISLPTRALLEIWFQSLGMDWHLIDWSDHILRRCSFRDLTTPEQKKQSHWADVYASGIRISYRLSAGKRAGGENYGPED